MTKKLAKLAKGKVTQLSNHEILDAMKNFPNMGYENYNKCNKALIKNCGCRVKLSDEEMVGSGFLNKAKKIGKTIGKVAVKSGLANVVIDEAIGALPIPQTAQNMASRAIKHELKDYTGAGIMKKVGRIGKNVGKTLVKSGVADTLIDEGLKNVGNEKYANLIGNVAKAGVRDITGSGIMKKMGRIGKNVGKTLVKSGVADVLIDEGLKNVSNEKYANLIGNVAKTGVRDLTGSGIMKKMGRIGKNVGKTLVKSGVADALIDEGLKNVSNEKYANLIGNVAKTGVRDLTGGGNPYLPHKLSGAGLERFGIPLRTYSDSSNLIRFDTDAFHPNVYNLPLYSTPIAQHVIKGKGFRVNG
jgi:hypothetical protein